MEFRSPNSGSEGFLPPPRYQISYPRVSLGKGYCHVRGAGEGIDVLAVELGIRAPIMVWKCMEEGSGASWWEVNGPWSVGLKRIVCSCFS